MIARSNRGRPQVRFLAEPQNIFLVLIGLSQEIVGSITDEFINIAKYDVSKFLYETSSVAHIFVPYSYSDDIAVIHVHFLTPAST